jgi:hypothetical protein
MNYALLYVSTARQGLTNADIEKLAVDAQAFNTQNDLTGLLLYSGTHFMQILEGNYDVLNPLLNRIIDDDRHSDVRVIMGAPATGRLFDKWSMGVIDIRNSDRIDPLTVQAIVDQAECDPDTAEAIGMKTLDLCRFFEIHTEGVTRA